MTGHLVTITSADENSFVQGLLSSDRDVWIAGLVFSLLNFLDVSSQKFLSFWSCLFLESYVQFIAIYHLNDRDRSIR